jgi:hypothetical protein
MVSWTIGHVDDTTKIHVDSVLWDLQDLRETLESVPSLSHAIIPQPCGRFAPLRKDTSYSLIHPS